MAILVWILGIVLYLCLGLVAVGTVCRYAEGYKCSILNIDGSINLAWIAGNILAWPLLVTIVSFVRIVGLTACSITDIIMWIVTKRKPRWLKSRSEKMACFLAAYYMMSGQAFMCFKNERSLTEEELQIWFQKCLERYFERFGK